jgi:hypothetical protein
MYLKIHSLICSYISYKEDEGTVFVTEQSRQSQNINIVYSILIYIYIPRIYQNKLSYWCQVPRT